LDEGEVEMPDDLARIALQEATVAMAPPPKAPKKPAKPKLVPDGGA